MSDRDHDKLLEIGKAMSALEPKIDPRIERWAHGTLSADEVTRLRRDADEDPELKFALQMFEPLSDDLQDKIVQSALASTHAQGRVVPMRRAAIALALTTAAAATLLFVLPTTDDSLPDYRIELSPTSDEWRGGEPPRVVQLATEVSIVMRPEVAVSDEIEAGLFVVAGGKAVSSPVAAEVSPRGAVRWMGSVGTLTAGLTGEVRLVAVVTPPGRLPAPEQVLAPAPDATWRARSIVLRLESSSGP